MFKGRHLPRRGQSGTMHVQRGRIRPKKRGRSTGGTSSHLNMEHRLMQREMKEAEAVAARMAHRRGWGRGRAAGRRASRADADRVEDLSTISRVCDPSELEVLYGIARDESRRGFVVPDGMVEEVSESEEDASYHGSSEEDDGNESGSDADSKDGKPTRTIRTRGALSTPDRVDSTHCVHEAHQAVNAAFTEFDNATDIDALLADATSDKGRAFVLAGETLVQTAAMTPVSLRATAPTPPPYVLQRGWAGWLRDICEGTFAFKRLRSPAPDAWQGSATCSLTGLKMVTGTPFVALCTSHTNQGDPPTGAPPKTITVEQVAEPFARILCSAGEFLAFLKAPPDESCNHTDQEIASRATQTLITNFKTHRKALKEAIVSALYTTPIKGTDEPAPRPRKRRRPAATTTTTK